MSEQPRRDGWVRWPDGSGPRIGYGADYNPEQWSRAVWDEDARLMQEAGVSIVSLAIFSWARLQPAPDRWDFAWLDEAMDVLHRHGVAVDLATATASPPPWLTTAHPEVLPVTERGEVVWPGARQHWRPTSPVFREHALRLVEQMAGRYAGHPALAAWHVSNELGCHNVYDYSDDAAAAFRRWLSARYGSVDELNRAWGTAFWSQHYGDWAEVLPPRLAASHVNPTQQLDFKRFSSAMLRDYLGAEVEVLRRLSPGVPVTTNFMVMGNTKAMDYASWADAVDFVSNDHYRVAGPRELDELSFSANLTSGVAGHRPWFLLEHSTSAVNWQPVNRPKRRGELARDSLTHVAHGADAVCFFQWRQSAAGAEKYHSAMVPHAGEDTELFRDVCTLGADLRRLSVVAGSRRLPADVAILFDWDSWWAAELDSKPSSLLRYRDEVLDWYAAMLDVGVRADVVPVSASLEDYRVVVAPMLHVVTEEQTGRLRRVVESGRHLVTTYFSGIVDADDHVWLGGYPGALRDLLGIRVEEAGPLLAGDTVTLEDGAVGSRWTERVDVVADDVEVLSRYASGEYAGRAAVTRRAGAAGSAAYVSTGLGAQALADLVGGLLTRAGVTSELPDDLRGAVELVVRRGGPDEFWFLVNRTPEPRALTGVAGETIVRCGAVDTGTDAATVPAPGVVVLRRPARD